MPHPIIGPWSWTDDSGAPPVVAGSDVTHQMIRRWRYGGLIFFVLLLELLEKQ